MKAVAIHHFIDGDTNAPVQELYEIAPDETVQALVERLLTYTISVARHDARHGKRYPKSQDHIELRLVADAPKDGEQ